MSASPRHSTVFAPAGPREGGAPKPVHLLIVEDNEDGAEAMAVLMGALGYDVRVARDGPEAIEAVRAKRPQVVFLDIGLPGMDGYQVARHLREGPGGKGMRLVALSGYGGEEDRRQAREAGFDDHLVKPIGIDALKEILSRITES